MKNRYSFIATILAVHLLATNVIAAPMYVDDGAGNVTGITGLESGGFFWDMELHNMSYNELVASIGIDQAVYSQVFSSSISQALAAFLVSDPSYSPDSFAGCSSPANCRVTTAYRSSSSLVAGFNVMYDNFGTAVVLNRQFNASFNLSDVTFATWTKNLPEPSVVPVPAAAWLFGSGLIGLIGVARRKKA